MRTRVIYAQSPVWAEAAMRAEALIRGAGFEPVKDEGRTRAGFVALENGARAFIKRFEAGSRGRGLWARVRGSRARRSLQGAELLESRGFRRPEPYAAAEVIDAGGISTSYLVSEALFRAATFSAFLKIRGRSPEPEARWRAGILKAVAREVRRFHEAGLFSSDLQETNLMLEEAGGECRIYFVDLDRLRSPRRVRWRPRERNLVQLDRSVGRFLSRSARLRFLYAYLGGRPERQRARELVGALLERRAREDRYRQRRPANADARRDAALASSNVRRG